MTVIAFPTALLWAVVVVFGLKAAVGLYVIYLRWKTNKKEPT
jgi:hypothetical protein